MEDKYNKIDEALVPFHEHINAMLDIEGYIKNDDAGCSSMIEEVGIESPVQLDIIVDDEGKVTIGSSPPLYYVDTAVQPIFHSIRFRAVPEQPDNETTIV